MEAVETHTMQQELTRQFDKFMGLVDKDGSNLHDTQIINMLKIMGAHSINHPEFMAYVNRLLDSHHFTRLDSITNLLYALARVQFSPSPSAMTFLVSQMQ